MRPFSDVGRKSSPGPFLSEFGKFVFYLYQYRFACFLTPDAFTDQFKQVDEYGLKESVFFGLDYITQTDYDPPLRENKRNASGKARTIAGISPSRDSITFGPT
jgi:hypothetical protein